MEPSIEAEFDELCLAASLLPPQPRSLHPEKNRYSNITPCNNFKKMFVLTELL